MFGCNKELTKVITKPKITVLIHDGHGNDYLQQALLQTLNEADLYYDCDRLITIIKDSPLYRQAVIDKKQGVLEDAVIAAEKARVGLLEAKNRIL